MATRVLVLTTHTLRYGAPRLRRLAQVLAEAGYDVAVIAPADRETVRGNAGRGFAIRRVLMPRWRRAPRAAAAIGLIGLAARALSGAEILITDDTPGFVAGSVIKRWQRCRLLVGYFGEIAVPGDSGGDTPSVRHLVRRSHLLDMAVDVEPNRARLRTEWLKLSCPVFVVRNCPLRGWLSSSADQVGAPQATPAADNEFRLLFTGAVAEGRGIDRALRAVRKCRERVRLIIAGESHPDMRPALEEATKVTYLGRVEREALPRLMQEADAGLVLYPYVGRDTVFRYCAPNKLHEYLAAGLPVICSDNPSLQFVQEEQLGFCCDPDDEEAIARTIDRLAHDRALLCEMSERARHAFQDRYNYEAQSSSFVRALTEVCPP